MPVPTLTWRQSAIGTLSASTLAACMADLKALIDAEVAAHPSTACWQVANYNSGNGTLVLKPTNGDTRRFMIFGGSSPNTNAIDAATALTTSLYCGLADSAGVDAPEQAYATGVPFTTGHWLAGGIVAIASSYTGIDRVQYYENAKGIFIVWRRNVMNQASGNSFTAFGGQLAVSLDGNTAYDISGASSGTWVANVDTVSVAAVGHPFSLGTETTAANPRTNYYETGFSTVSRCRKFMVPTLSGLQDKLRSSGQVRFFVPFLMANSDTVRTTIKLRQIALGISEVHDQVMNDAAGAAAIKVGFRGDQVDHGPWLTNFSV